MTQQKLNVEQDFLVRESVALNYIAGTILLIVFFASMAVGDYGWGNFLSALGLLVVPAGFYLAKGRRNKTSIKINKTGFYYAGKLVTGWEYFIDAEVTQKKVTGSIKDNVILLFRYYDTPKAFIYNLEIPLSDTQDKAAEEIIEAIDFYYNSSRHLYMVNDLNKQSN
jgi:hypothetical protein